MTREMCDRTGVKIVHVCEGPRAARRAWRQSVYVCACVWHARVQVDEDGGSGADPTDPYADVILAARQRSKARTAGALAAGVKARGTVGKRWAACTGP